MIISKRRTLKPTTEAARSPPDPGGQGVPLRRLLRFDRSPVPGRQWGAPRRVVVALKIRRPPLRKNPRRTALYTLRGALVSTPSSSSAGRSPTGYLDLRPPGNWSRPSAARLRHRQARRAGRLRPCGRPAKAACRLAGDPRGCFRGTAANREVDEDGGFSPKNRPCIAAPVLPKASAPQDKKDIRLVTLPSRLIAANGWTCAPWLEACSSGAPEAFPRRP